MTLLGLLERKPSYGYDLKRDYDGYFGRGKQLQFGQVYATLARLVRDGKVVAGEVEPGAGPDRKRYVITEAGVTEVDSWLAEPAEQYLDAQRTMHLRRMRELTALKQDGGPLDASLADYGLFHLEADLRWIDVTAARLDTLAEEVLR